jgi:hypothetical protein
MTCPVGMHAWWQCSKKKIITLLECVILTWTYCRIKTQVTQHRGRLVITVFVLHVREVPGTDLGLETGYPDWRFLWFPSRQIPGQSLKTTACFQILSQFIIHVSPPHSTLYTVFLLTERASINKLQKHKCILKCTKYVFLLYTHAWFLSS